VVYSDLKTHKIMQDDGKVTQSKRTKLLHYILKKRNHYI